MKEQLFGRRYRVTEKIGAGGMADIFRAVDETLGRTVAVKVMHARYASDPEFAARFRREAQAAANLVSPNIVNMYDWGQDGDTYYIVMEYVRGCDLKQLERDGAMPSDWVAQVGAQVCSALSVAHGYDVIHRDVKPHNIMVQPDGSVKVMDFGIARAGDSELTQTGSVMGTAQYLSPEQAQGKPLSPASDLYSLGVTLYEAATGRLPFHADSPVAVALMHVNAQPAQPHEVNPAIDPALEAVILKAMQKSPAHRYGSADEMRRELNATVTGAVNAPTSVMGRVAGTALLPVVPFAAVVAAAVPTPTLLDPDLYATRGPSDDGQAAGRIRDRQDDARRTAGRPAWVWALLALLLVGAGLGMAWRMGAEGNTPVAPGDSGVTPSARSTATPAAEPATEAAPVVVPKPEMVAVPDIMDMSEADAIATLQEAGFSPAALPVQYNADVDAGKVYTQSPEVDVPAERQSVVQYAISAGPDPATLSWKDRRGKAGKSGDDD